MEPNYSIRIAKKDDAPKLVELWKGLMRYHENCVSDYIMSKDAEEKWKVYLDSFFNTGEKIAFVAVRSDEIVGYIFAMIKQKPPVFEENRVGEIGDTFVREDAHGNDVGRNLVEAASKWLKDMGMKSIEVNMYMDNALANAFWSSMNFESYFLTRRKY